MTSLQIWRLQALCQKEPCYLQPTGLPELPHALEQQTHIPAIWPGWGNWDIPAHTTRLVPPLSHATNAPYLLLGSSTALTRGDHRPWRDASDRLAKLTDSCHKISALVNSNRATWRNRGSCSSKVKATLELKSVVISKNRQLFWILIPVINSHKYS